MYLATALRRLRREEHGFTLIELLVAMLAGVVVAAAAMAILIISYSLSSQTNDRIDANQQGRLALTKITQALGSSCVAASTPPVLSANVAGGATNADQITFYSSLTDGPNVTPSEVTIALTGGALMMYTYPENALTGSTDANSGQSIWTWQTTPTPFTLLPYATTATIGGSVQPVFEYWDYNSSDALQPISIGAGSLTSAQALTVAEVTVNFKALPSDDNSADNRGVDFTDSVALRLTPVSSDASASTTPCT
jgi:prepilin-type N-terminal cleavage/methylation domain-containing protein